MSGLSRTALLVVSGGVSAYKSAVVARELGRRGFAVETVLTPAAQRFVTLTFAAITGRAPWTEPDPRFSGEVHIDLTSRTDLTLVAPATADLMARASAAWPTTSPPPACSPRRGRWCSRPRCTRGCGRTPRPAPTSTPSSRAAR
ncbi:MAG: flavoprotein [Polyangiales bacterium]